MPFRLTVSEWADVSGVAGTKPFVDPGGRPMAVATGAGGHKVISLYRHGWPDATALGDVIDHDARRTMMRSKMSAAFGYQQSVVRSSASPDRSIDVHEETVGCGRT